MNSQYSDKVIDEIDAKVGEWLAFDPNELTRQEIRDLRAQNSFACLSKKLLQRISFGTAGLRSSNESGFAHMNDVTVLQASQGLVAYILKMTASSSSRDSASIVIGYDHRHRSQRFAEISASVSLAAGVKVYYLGSVHLLLPELDPLQERDYSLTVHTPMVPFAIKTLGASAGIMVTASHNPANDNGYKVYYGNGCQIIPPHDLGIASAIEQNLEPWNDKNVWNVCGNFDLGRKSGRLVHVHDETTKKYVETICNKLIAANVAITYPFVYTPMHGVGQAVFSRICSTLGGENPISFVEVEQQKRPNPDFPSVRFPNPEESGALDLAISKAREAGCRLVIANDPDADRFSLAFETRDHGWRQLTGNEIGSLFAAYVLELIQKGESMGSNPTQNMGSLGNTYLINSTVSSQLLKAMAEKEGFGYKETLTGFKWIGNKALELKNEGFHVPFAYEEAIGYMFSVVDDKDGISSAVVFLQLFQQWFSSGDLFPDEKLLQIYEKYGFFKECNGYYKLDDTLKTNKIFDEIRESYNAQNFPRAIGDLHVLSWRDLTVGYDSTGPSNIPNLPTDPSSQMITAVVKDNKGATARFTCRGSGTEPKLKVYIEGKAESEEEALRIARFCWKTLEEEWFRPKENQLEVVV